MVSTRFKNCRRTFGLPELDNFDGALIFFENRQHLQFAELKKNGNRSWSGVISLKFNTNFSSVQFKRFLMFFHISHRHSKGKSGLMCTPITSEIIQCNNQSNINVVWTHKCWLMCENIELCTSALFYELTRVVMGNVRKV